MDDSGALFLPLVRWPNAPSATTHRVTCVSASPAALRSVATGAANGSIVLWRTPYAEPHALLEGHSARVGALCDAVFVHATATTDESANLHNSNNGNHPNNNKELDEPRCTDGELDLNVVVSFADDGSVGAWRYVDGECVAFVTNVAALSESAVRVAVPLADRRTVVCAGEAAPHLVVFDVSKMHVVTLLSRLPSPLRALVYAPAADVIFLAYASGVVAASSTAQIGAGERALVCVSPAASLVAPLVALCVADDAAFAVLVAPRRVALVASRDGDSVVLAAADAPDGAVWIGAELFGAQHVVLWDARGSLFVFQFNERLQAVLAGLAAPAVAKMGSCRALDVDVAGCALLLTRERLAVPANGKDVPVECGASLAVTCGVKQGQCLVFGSTDGRLCAWRVSPKSGAVDEAPAVRAWTHAWTPLTQYASRRAVPSAADVTNTTCSFVTTSPTGSALLMICGHANGHVSVAEFPDTAASLPSAFNRHWPAHTGAVLRVTTINMHGTWYLISAGVDCAVSVWLLKGAKHIHTFREHVAPVTGLRALPPIDAETAQHTDGLLHVPLDTCFVTVSSDRTVCIYSLAALKCVRRFAGHVAPLEAVWWRPAFDYVFVLCSDGAFVVWELSTGRLESSQRGEDVASLTADAELLWRASERRMSSAVGAAPFVRPVGLRFERCDAPAMASIATPLPHVSRCTDVQVIVLNVRELIEAVRAGQLAALPAPAPPPVPAAAAAATAAASASEAQAAASRRMQLALELITVLLPWGADSNIDRLCRDELGFKRPLIPPTQATLGAASKISLLLPTLTPAAAEGRIEDADVRSASDLLAHMWRSLSSYTQSSEISALHSVTTCALLRLMLASQRDGASNAASHVLTYLCTLLPTTMPTYVPPSFEFLTLHYFDNDDDVALTTRTIFASALEVALERDVQFVARWAHRFASEQAPFERCLTLLLLGIVGSTNADLLDVELQRTIADELYTGVFRETGVLQAACGELLARGYNTWCGHLMRPLDSPDEPADAAAAADDQGKPKRNLLRVAFKRSTGSLAAIADMAVAAEAKMLGARLDGIVLQMFCLSMAHDAAHLSSRRTARTARQALLQIGARDPRRFLAVLSEELTHPHKHNAERPMPYLDQRNTSQSQPTRSLLESLPARASHSRRRLVAEFDASPEKQAPTAPTAAAPTAPAAASSDTLAVYGGNNITVMVRGADRRPAAGASAVVQHNAGQSATHALKLVMALLMEEPGRVLSLLERVVEIGVRALDPHVPQVRDGALQAITQLLQFLVHKYPGVSFHKDTQRLALGTTQATVVIYDLKAATKWHVLEGHSASVAAVAFSDSGRLLASYSYKDRSVMVWHMTSSFLGFGAPSCKAVHKVTAVDIAPDDVAALLATKLVWRSETSLRLSRAGQPDFDLDGV